MTFDRFVVGKVYCNAKEDRYYKVTYIEHIFGQGGFLDPSKSFIKCEVVCICIPRGECTVFHDIEISISDTSLLAKLEEASVEKMFDIMQMMAKYSLSFMMRDVYEGRFKYWGYPKGLLKNPSKHLWF